jgi:hypothetical protein
MLAATNLPRWNILVLSLIVLAMAHLTAASSSRLDDAWPALLSTEAADLDPAVALLHQRANGALEKLLQSARAPEQPL